jgi:pyruvate/2-oxoglutarate dehydrogenase complex dihydrolipoamide acyltransferase (E2) component
MSSSPTDTVAAIDVLMPQMGTSMTEGTVISWLKSEGDQVTAEETICEISTDKIDTECPAPVGGTLVTIVVPEGETVEVGAVIGRIAGDGAVVAPPPSPSAAARRTPTVPEDGRRYSPVVQRIAAEHSIDLATVAASGRGGRVTKKDVLAAIDSAPVEPLLHSDSPYKPDPAPTAAAAAAAPAPPGPDDLGGVAEPLSRVRRSIGAAMVASQQTAATCHTIVECDVSQIERRRAELGLTALPLIARATIDTLAEFPDLNATLDGETISRFTRVHLGIAVSLGDEGLIVPVIHDAQDLSPEGLGKRIKDIARRARAKELGHDDVHGATFTITNPGQFGATLATPVINQPQVGILDLEAVIRRPVVVTDPAGAEAIAIRPMANLVLGWDHRAMDGVYAARFLAALRSRVEGETA